MIFRMRAVNWEPLGQFTANFAQLLELIVLRSVYFLVKFRFFIQELWERKSLQILYECWRRAYHAHLAQVFISFWWLTVRFQQTAKHSKCWFYLVMVNTAFNNISVIFWWSVLLVEETGVPGENHRPVTSHWQTKCWWHVIILELVLSWKRA